MEKKVRIWKALGYAKRKKRLQEGRSAGRSQAARRVFMTAGAIVGAVVLIGAVVSPLWAQPYPNKPIRLILPMPPGGSVDTVGRIIAPKLAERLGQPVVCENRPGAGGNVGWEYVAKTRPDGYTIVVGAISLTISPSLYKKLGYDPVKDLAPIALVSQHHTAMLVRPALPVKELKELVEYARANPGKLNYASTGTGTPGHLLGELFKILAKVRIVHVPYKGAGPALTGLLGGEVDIGFISVVGALPHIQAGKLKPLAVLSDKRDWLLPAVPTAKEAGIDDYELINWHGILAPAGTPREIINRLNQEWGKIAAMPDTGEKLRRAGFEPLSSTPEQFSEFLKSETTRWTKIIKEANIPAID